MDSEYLGFGRDDYPDIDMETSILRVVVEVEVEVGRG
jgi:hypothetical protein